jgi:hypothetical protein
LLAPAGPCTRVFKHSRDFGGKNDKQGAMANKCAKNTTIIPAYAEKYAKPSKAINTPVLKPALLSKP